MTHNRWLLTAKDSLGYTALHWACKNGHFVRKTCRVAGICTTSNLMLNLAAILVHVDMIYMYLGILNL